MKRSFYIIAKVFKCQPDGSVARDYYGNAETKHVITSVETETLQDAHDIGEKIADDNWLEFTVCSEAGRMWKNGEPALFNLESFAGIGRLKEMPQ
ncbi:hypothetical protein LCGC14_2271200 [marine sediment metagenome]|uniref:Uncharacterized protein n=1 Tax=marine sediment metagenome TaxID=412755 RepID=A0A0F9CX61_9ZZZZ